VKNPILFINPITIENLPGRFLSTWKLSGTMDALILSMGM